MASFSEIKEMKYQLMSIPKPSELDTLHAQAQEELDVMFGDEFTTLLETIAIQGIHTAIRGFAGVPLGTCDFDFHHIYMYPEHFVSKGFNVTSRDVWIHELLKDRLSAMFSGYEIIFVHNTYTQCTTLRVKLGDGPRRDCWSLSENHQWKFNGSVPPMK